MRSTRETRATCPNACWPCWPGCCLVIAIPFRFLTRCGRHLAEDTAGWVAAWLIACGFPPRPPLCRTIPPRCLVSRSLRLGELALADGPQAALDHLTVVAHGSPGHIEEHTALVARRRLDTSHLHLHRLAADGAQLLV